VTDRTDSETLLQLSADAHELFLLRILHFPQQLDGSSLQNVWQDENRDSGITITAARFLVGLHFLYDGEPPGGSRVWRVRQKPYRLFAQCSGTAACAATAATA
jgi:hypothetical protein